MERYRSGDRMVIKTGLPSQRVTPLMAPAQLNNYIKLVGAHKTTRTCTSRTIQSFGWIALASTRKHTKDMAPASALAAKTTKTSYLQQVFGLAGDPTRFHSTDSGIQSGLGYFGLGDLVRTRYPGQARLGNTCCLMFLVSEELTMVMFDGRGGVG